MQLSDFINLNTFILIGTILFGLTSWWGAVKSGGLGALRQSNEDLRKLVDDQTKELAELRADMARAEAIMQKVEEQKAEIDKSRERIHALGNEITSLKLQVQHLSDFRENYERLIHGALLEFFANDPQVAKTLRLSIMGVEERQEVANRQYRARRRAKSKGEEEGK
jgi:predicted nuclease with TOPRIM domain